MVGAESHGTHAEGAPASADAGGAARVEDGCEGEQRAAGSGAAGDGGAGGGAGTELRGCGTRGWVAERDDRQQPGPAVQSGRLGVLRIAAGRGRRPTYDAAARARIVATAQRSPDRKVDGTATWSLSTLERTLRREGLPRVGATTIRRVLHDAGSSYQRTRTWCPTGTAQRKRKAGVVQVVDPKTEEKRGPSTWRTG